LRGLTLPDLTPVRERNLPVMVVVGEDDEYGSPAEIRAALASLGNALTVVEIAGADHFYMAERHEVAAAVADFLLERLGKASSG
jgi:pimeloyl-ACP methyl ester carboxylesterase